MWYRKTIAVQAAPTIEETEFILSLSERPESIIGVIGWIDIDNSSYEKQLETFRKNPKFVGICFMIPIWIKSKLFESVLLFLEY
ncbi:hypothetical protein ACFFHM_06440 [Halalkalibacter kiskunsagensis]|uniref:Uncharacterized protein n=1 Tax=Halalkalibacter kiskunsagensis TaxID=1548599 RepID=A0ABV6KA30_9BACI